MLKESNKNRFESYGVRKSVLNISYITFRDCRVHIFPTTFLEIAVYLVKRWQAFLLKTCSDSSNDEGDGDGDGNEPNKYMKNNKFCLSSALFFTTCTNAIVNFLLRPLFGGHKHNGKLGNVGQQCCVRLHAARVRTLLLNLKHVLIFLFKSDVRKILYTWANTISWL